MMSGTAKRNAVGESSENAEEVTGKINKTTGKKDTGLLEKFVNVNPETGLEN